MATSEDSDPSQEDGSDERIGTEPIDGEGRYPFAGLTRYDDDVDAVTLPEGVWTDTSSMRYWAMNETDHTFSTDAGVERDLDPSVLPERGLHTLTHELPRANHAVPAWVHPRTGEVMKTGKHNAVINPEAAERAAGSYGTHAEAIADQYDYDQDTVAEAISEMGLESTLEELLTPSQRTDYEDVSVGDDALYQIAGDDHSIINPQQPLEELCNELQDRGMADKVFGEVTLDRGGGRATLDVYIDGQHVESPVFDDDREPVVVGLQVQWSFFSDWAFRVCGQGLDWACTNHISRLTDREVVKYAGDVESRTDWRELFSDVLDALDEKRSQLADIIQQAASDTLDLGDLPSDIGDAYEDMDAGPWTALYAYMGLPNYLAEHAGKRLRSQADDAYEPNWWEIHSAATYAVTHHDRGERTSGGSFEDHARVANDMLFNPPLMEDRIVENYEADRMDDEESTIAEEGGGSAEIRSAFDSVRERKEQYEQWEKELKEMGVEV
jgi:hypothetical protein